MLYLSDDSFRFPCLYEQNKYVIQQMENKWRNGLTDDLGQIVVVPFSFTSDLLTTNKGGLKDKKGRAWTRDVTRLLLSV
jgi:hypothetical protein